MTKKEVIERMQGFIIFFNINCFCIATALYLKGWHSYLLGISLAMIFSPVWYFICKRILEKRK